MKGVEQDYQYSEVMKEINQALVERKELRAQKAKLLSVKNLQRYAKKFNMEEPQQSHIIVVP